MDVLITRETLPRLAEKLASSDEVGLDYETTSFHPMEKAALQFDRLKPVGWGFGFPDGEAFYLPVAHQIGDNLPFEETVELLRKVLTDPHKIVWAHNVKFEAMVSNVLRIEHRCQWRCSLLAQWLLGKGFRGKRGHKLKAAVQEYLGHKMITWEEVIPNKARAHMVAPSVMAPYCADDALQGLRLGNHFLKDIKELGMEKVFVELEMPIASEVIPHMDEAGVEIDRKFLRNLATEYSTEMKVLQEEFYKLFKISISSNAKISTKFYDQLKLWPILPQFKRGKSGRISVDANHRKMVRASVKEGTEGHRALDLKDRYQRLSKIVSTYTHSIIKRADRYVDGRVRCEWRQHGTETGRFASRNPNLQNVPIRTEEGRRVRDAFVAAMGWNLYDRDYSGADLRVFAHLCRDERMLERFNSDDDDLHQETADACGVKRQTGKTANLGLIYEMGSKTLGKGIGAPEHVAQRIWEEWHATYPRVRRYHRRQHAYARKHGFVRTITGRIRPTEGIDSSKTWLRLKAEHASTNTPAQGSVGDIIKIAMRNLVKEWKDRGVLFNWYTKKGKAKVTIQVHDELVIELKDGFKEEGAADVKRHMEEAVELRVPLKTDGGFGRTWLEAH